MLAEAGLTFVRVYVGGFRGEEYGVSTRRMIVVAKKDSDLMTCEKG
jgi:hypothetical protein